MLYLKRPRLIFICEYCPSENSNDEKTNIHNGSLDNDARKGGTPGRGSLVSVHLFSLRGALHAAAENLELLLEGVLLLFDAVLTLSERELLAVVPARTIQMCYLLSVMRALLSCVM